MAQRFVLTGERCRRDLSHHESGIQPGVVNQKRRQTREGRVGEFLYAPLTDGAE